MNSEVNKDRPSMREADLLLKSTVDNVNKLNERVSALERDTAVMSNRLNAIEETVDEVKKAIDKMQTIAVTTLLSVVGSGGFIIYELLKMRIVQ